MCQPIFVRQTGQFGCCVATHRVIHAAWNVCPHGKTPHGRTLSLSKQIQHSSFEGIATATTTATASNGRTWTGRLFRRLFAGCVWLYVKSKQQPWYIRYIDKTEAIIYTIKITSIWTFNILSPILHFVWKLKSNWGGNVVIPYHIFNPSSPNEKTRRDFEYCWLFQVSNSAIDENR